VLGIIVPVHIGDGDFGFVDGGFDGHINFLDSIQREMVFPNLKTSSTQLHVPH
jgi:hypothetical protein